MPAPLMQLAMQAGSQAVSGATGMLLGSINDKRQLKQQKKLQALQLAGNKEMLDYQKMKDLEFWEATGPGAYKKLLEEADLNPALMYGMGGGGSQTTGSSGSGVSGGNAPVGGGEMALAMQSGMQLQLMQAQKENIEADTNLKKTDAAKTAGVDTKEGEARIASLTQGIENQKAQEQLTKLEVAMKTIDQYVATQTTKERIETIVNESTYTLERLDQIARENRISKATELVQIDTVKVEYTAALLRNTLTISETKAKEAATQLMEAQKRATEKGIDLTDYEIKEIVKKIGLMEETRQNLHEQTKNIERDQTRKDDELDLKEKGQNMDVLEKVIPSVKQIVGGKRR